MKKKLIVSILLIIVVILVFQNISMATGMDSVFSQGDSFLSNGENPLDSEGNPIVSANMENVGSLSSLMYKILFALFLPMAIIVGVVLGIKYMIASVDEKAAVKQSLIAYFVAVVIMFGGFGIWSLVVNILS